MPNDTPEHPSAPAPNPPQTWNYAGRGASGGDEPPIQFSHWRAAIALCVISAGLATLVGRVAYLQTYGRQQIILKAERQHHQSQPLPARRGSIFDRNGMLLACTVQNDGVFVDPHFLHESYQDKNMWDRLEPDIRALAKLLDVNYEGLSKMLADRSEERYIKLSDMVDERTAQEILKLKMPGVCLIPVNHRVYPLGSLAAHIIGGVGKDQVGLEGLEMKYDKVLAGKDGRQRVLKDAKRRNIGIAEEDYIPPEHGQHLVLTIDANIQMIAEQELAVACELNKTERGEVVVIDPRTGDVLALANYPTFNPQMIADAAAEIRRNNALVSPYEPGSAIKPFIVGPALEHGVTTWGQMWPINTESWLTPYGRRITDTHFYGPLCTWDVLVKSSNIGMSMLGERMTNPALRDALSGFGFGKRAGIELAGEDPGMLRPIGSWSKSSTESIAQGYEILVTPLQLARAFCAYANGGRLLELRLVKGTVDVDGNITSSRVQKPLEDEPQVIDPEAAMKIRRILADVPLRGTATSMKAYKTGTKDYVVPTWYIWNMFGKTGTAHIVENGHYAQKYNATFMGGAPYENPRLVLAMTLHKPSGGAYYGGTVSGPPAARILGRSLEYLQADPSPELPLPPSDIQGRLIRFDPEVYKKPTTQPANKTAAASN